jgi:hypothetical protein
MSSLEILQCSCAAEVERVLADTAITRAGALATCDVGEAMLDRDAIAKTRSAAW